MCDIQRDQIERGKEEAMEKIKEEKKRRERGTQRTKTQGMRGDGISSPALITSLPDWPPVARGKHLTLAPIGFSISEGSVRPGEEDNPDPSSLAGILASLLSFCLCVFLPLLFFFFSFSFLHHTTKSKMKKGVYAWQFSWMVWSRSG